ncbi:MAG: adenosine deaminase [Spirochaetales bacterium]
MGDLKKFIASIPKTEIHLHIEMCVSATSYETLMDKYDIPHDEKTTALTDFSKIASLQSMIESFYFVQSFFREPEDFQLVVDDVIAYAKRNNIAYIEAFASPSMVLNRGLISFDQMFTTLVKGFDKAYKKEKIDVRLIVDVSRSFGPKNAMKNLDHTLAFLKKTETDRVLGIGLGGQEIGHPCADYEAVFAKARKAGLHVVAHAGEEVGPESVWEALEVLKAERVGHGISSIQDPKLMDRLKKDKTPLEICPTSNVYTKKYVERYSDHPIRKFFEAGLFVTVNTDDPILFSIELNQEMHKLASEIGFSRDELLAIVKNGIDATFLSTSKKKTLWKNVLTSVGKA